MSNFWLPSSHWNDLEAARRIGARVTIGWSEATGTSIKSTRLIELASSMSTETLLLLVASLSFRLSQASPASELERKRLQADMARSLCPAHAADGVIRLLETGRFDAWIHEEQLLLAVKVAILHGQPGVAADAINSAVTGELLLGLNDILREDEHAFEQTSNEMIALALRRIGLFRNEQLRYQMGRYYNLLATRSRGQQGEQGSLDLDTAFLQQTGLSIEDYLGFALMYVARLWTPRDVEEFRAAHYQVREDEQQIDERAIQRACRRGFARNRKDFRSDFSRQQSLKLSSFRPLRKGPLFRQADGALVPTSMPLLLDKMSMGVYWELHNYSTESGSDFDVNHFTEYLGHLFESYLTELLQRTYPATGKSRFFDDTTIQELSGRGELPSFDGILVEEDGLVPIEMGVTALTATVMEEADPKRFAVEIDDKFLKKVEQLKRTPEDIAQGKWQIPSLRRDATYQVFPVLALLHPFPQLTSTVSVLRDVLPEGEYAVSGPSATLHVHPAQLVTAEEFEMLEPLVREGGEALPNLLRRRLDRPDRDSVSMKTFLLRILNITEMTNHCVWKLTEEALESARRHLLNHLGSQPSTGEGLDHQ